MKIGARHYNPLFSALDFDRYPPSIANLPAALTINGQTKYPTLRYKGGDATSSLWKPWGYGETLTLQAGTAPTYNNGSPLLGASDDSVKFNGGGYYVASNASFADITTEDYVLEVISQTNVITKTLLSKFAESPYHGWYFQSRTDGVQVSMYHSNVHTQTVYCITSSLGTIRHTMFFMDRSGSGYAYADGAIASDAASLIPAAASLTNTAPFRIGSSVPSVNQFSSDSLFYCAMWKQSNWLDTHLQATVAQTRFAQLTGVYPQSARGTYLPTAVTRSSAGYLDKIEADGTTKIYYMGSNWPRVCSRKDSSGVIRKGYLSETSAVNSALCTNSSAPVGIEFGTATQTTGAGVAPDGSTTMTRLVEATGAVSVHGRYGANSFTSVLNDIISVSGWVRLGDRCGGIGVMCGTHGAPNAVIVDPATGAVGYNAPVHFTIVAGSYGAIDYGNGLWRVYAQFKNTFGNETTYPFWCLASNTTTTSYAGNVTTNPLGALFWGISLTKAAYAYPSSYIPTTTAAVTRSADLLRYKMDDGNMSTVRGSLECSVLLPNIDNAGSPTPWSLSDGTGNNRIAALAASAGHDYATLAITAATVAQAAVAQSTDIWNNGWNKLRGIWGPNDARMLVNSVSEGTPDSTVTVPTGLTQLDVGAYLSAGYELGGLLSNLKILGRNTTRG